MREMKMTIIDRTIGHISETWNSSRLGNFCRRRAFCRQSHERIERTSRSSASDRIASLGFTYQLIPQVHLYFKLPLYLIY